MASTLYDPIMDALLAHLQQSCGTTFRTYSRRFMTWEQMTQAIQMPNVTQGNPPPQPALYLYDGVGFGGGTTTYVQAGRTPVKRTLKRSIVIYARIPVGDQPEGPDFTTPGGSVFYPLIEAVEAAIDVDDNLSLSTLTLGGLVTHCWIEGDGVIVPGDIDPQGQGMAVLPVNILVP